MSDISDTDERARYEYDDGWMLIILRIPYVKEIRSRTPYTTVPLGIIHKRDVTITVCYYLRMNLRRLMASNPPLLLL